MLNEESKKFYVQKTEKYNQKSKDAKKMIIGLTVLVGIQTLQVVRALLNGDRGTALGFGISLSISVIVTFRNIMKKSNLEGRINAINELLQYHGVDLSEMAKVKRK